MTGAECADTGVPHMRVSPDGASGGGSDAEHCQQCVFPMKLFARHRGHAIRVGFGNWVRSIAVTGTGRQVLTSDSEQRNALLSCLLPAHCNLVPLDVNQENLNVAGP